ncbi:MAG: hypothetical protein ABEJ95_05235 [Candidatus Nanohalobium sp.]
MQKKLKQVENTTEDSSKVLTSIFVYRKVLEDANRAYPKDFWNSNIEQKAEKLLRDYASRNNINPGQIAYRDIPDLVKKAKLQKPVNKAYLGNPYLLILDSFEQVTPEDLRWNIHPNPDPNEIEALRNQYCCMWKAISNYYDTKNRELKKIAGKENTKIEKSVIDAPVLETLLFWLEIKRIKQGKSTYEKLIDKMADIGWQKERTDKYLNRYDIKRQIGRFKTAKKTQRPLKQHNGKLYPTEQLVANKIRKEKLQKIKGYGADFLNQETNTIIEVKKKLSTVNITNAAIQLNYAEDHLEGNYNKAIYTETLDFPGNQYSSYKKYIKHYNIEIYEYNDSREEFELVKS